MNKYIKRYFHERVALFYVEIYVQWLRKRSKFAIFLHYYCNSFALMIRVTVLPFL